MKRTDKRFWKFEALALLSSFITVCIMILLLGPMDMDSFVYLAFVTCLPTYSIGQAFTWKFFKHGNWVNLCISIYLFTAIVFAVELLIVNLPKYCTFDDWTSISDIGKSLEPAYYPQMII